MALVRNRCLVLKDVRHAPKPIKRFSVLVAKALGFNDSALKRNTLRHVVEVLDQETSTLGRDESHHANVVVAAYDCYEFSQDGLQKFRGTQERREQKRLGRTRLKDPRQHNEPALRIKHGKHPVVARIVLGRSKDDFTKMALLAQQK